MAKMDFMVIQFNFIAVYRQRTFKVKTIMRYVENRAGFPALSFGRRYDCMGGLFGIYCPPSSETTMRIGFLLLLLISGLFMALPVSGDEGPLHVKNRFPLHLLFLTPRPVGPGLPAAGEFEASAAVDYSAVYFQHQNREWDFLIDLEMTTFDLAVTWGLTQQVALSVDLALVNMGGGFLDGFLENYHDALGVSNYGREARPENAFAYRAARDEQVWLQGESNTWQLADAVASAMIRIPAPAAMPAMSSALIPAVKLPLGDSERGTGSGRWDAGLYWTAVFEFAPWAIYMMPGFALISDPRTDGPDVESRDSYSLLAGAAYRYDADWRWLVQLNGYTSPLQRTGINQLDNGAVELAFGFHYRLKPNWRVEFAFCEDLTRAAPDFTVHLGVIWNYERKGGPE